MDQIPAHSTAKRRNGHGQPASWRQQQYSWRTGNYEECNRCGESNLYEHFCKALQRNCFICGKKGHHAKFCRNRSSRKPARTNDKFQNQQPAAKQQKSKRRRERDYRRLVTFKERKSVCTIMPFYEINDQEIVKFIPKNQCQQSETKFQEIKNENNDLQLLVNSLRKKVDELQQTLDSTIAQNQNLEAKLSQIEDKLKSAQKQSDSKTATDRNTCRQIKRLERENNDLKSELSKLQQQQQNNEAARQNGTTCSATQAKVEYKLPLLKQEMASMTNWYCALDSSNMIHPNQLVSPCQNCGSRMFHEQRTCPAIRNTCFLCLKPGHFAVFCQTKKLF